MKQLKYGDKFKLAGRTWEVGGGYEKENQFTTLVYLLQDSGERDSTHFLFLEAFEDEIEILKPESTYKKGRAYKYTVPGGGGCDWTSNYLRAFTNKGWINADGMFISDDEIANDVTFEELDN